MNELQYDEFIRLIETMISTQEETIRRLTEKLDTIIQLLKLKS